MIALVFSVLTLLGAAVTWWLRRPAAEFRPPPPVSMLVGPDQDLLPESGNREADGESGLAAFYAYQMAAGKIDRPG